MFVHPKKEPTHTEKMALTWRERTAQIEKNAPIREKATPMDFFIHPPPPGERLLLLPPFPGRAPTLAPSLRSADNDRPPPPPTHFILFFREF